MIARATGSEAASGSDAAQEVVLEVYSKIGWIAIAVRVGFLVISPLIKKLTHLDTLKDDDHMLAGESELAETAAAGTRVDEEPRLTEWSRTAGNTERTHYGRRFTFFVFRRFQERECIYEN